jgi:hypothetical protein
MKQELILDSDLNKISSENKCEPDGCKVAAGDSNMSRSQDKVQSNDRPVLRHTKQWQRCLQLLDMIVEDMHIFLALIIWTDVTSGTHWKTAEQFNTVTWWETNFSYIESYFFTIRFNFMNIMMNSAKCLKVYFTYTFQNLYSFQSLTVSGKRGPHSAESNRKNWYQTSPVIETSCLRCTQLGRTPPPPFRSSVWHTPDNMEYNIHIMRKIHSVTNLQQVINKDLPWMTNRDYGWLLEHNFLQ